MRNLNKFPICKKKEKYDESGIMTATHRIDKRK